MENMPLIILPCHRQNEPHHMGGLGCDANLGIGQDEYLSKGDVDVVCVHISGLGCPKVQRTPKESKWGCHYTSNNPKCPVPPHSEYNHYSNAFSLYFSKSSLPIRLNDVSKSKLVSETMPQVM